MSAVAGQKDKQRGKCIIDWYYGENQADTNGLFLASMKKYPDYKPSAMFLFFAQQECGKFYNVD